MTRLYGLVMIALALYAGYLHHRINLLDDQIAASPDKVMPGSFPAGPGSGLQPLPGEPARQAGEFRSPDIPARVVLAPVQSPADQRSAPSMVSGSEPAKGTQESFVDVDRGAIRPQTIPPKEVGTFVPVPEHP